MKSYLKTYLGMLFPSLLAIAGFNLIVDYQNIYRLVNIVGFNSEKQLIHKTGMRRTKSIDLARGEYDTLVLGNSRVTRGINPESEVFKGNSVYNAGLNDATLYEISQVLDYVKKHQDIKSVIIGLDFEGFFNSRMGQADFPQSGFANKNVYLASWKSLFYWQTIDYSWQTVKSQQYSPYFNYTERGFNHINYPVYPYRARFEEYSRQRLVSYQDRNFAATENNIKQNTKLLKKIIQDCQENQIQLYLYISPSHARELDIYQILGIFPLFETWKKQVTAMASQQNINLWDFSGYNSVNTEAITTLKSKQNMQWYWDLTHYKKDLGEIILAKLFDTKQKPKITNDFGKLVNPSNIDAHLAKIRQEQKIYQQRFPEEIEKVNQLAREVGIVSVVGKN